MDNTYPVSNVVLKCLMCNENVVTAVPWNLERNRELPVVICEAFHITSGVLDFKLDGHTSLTFLLCIFDKINGNLTTVR